MPKNPIQCLIIYKVRYRNNFDKKRQTFDLPLLFSGTDFQQQVFKALDSIHYGHTISYQQLARQMNHPLAIRAIAKANGENKLG